MKWFLKCLSRYFDFSGRSRRKEYWMFVLFSLIFLVVPAMIDTAIGHLPLGKYFGFLSGIYAILMLIPGIAVTVRRLHDIGMSGWSFWVVLLPALGEFFLLIWLCKPGENDDNLYGPDPKDEPNFTNADAWHDLKTNLKEFTQKKYGKIICLLLAELIAVIPSAYLFSRYELNFYYNNQSNDETELTESPTYSVVDTDEEGKPVNYSILHHASATSGEKDILETFGSVEIVEENKDGYAIIRTDEEWGVYGPDGEKVLDGSKIPSVSFPGSLSFVKGDDGKLLLENSYNYKRYDLEGNYVSTSFMAEHLYHFGMFIIVLIMVAVALLWYYLMWRRNNNVNAAEDEVESSDMSEPEQQDVE